MILFGYEFKDDDEPEESLNNNNDNITNPPENVANNFKSSSSVNEIDLYKDKLEKENAELKKQIETKNVQLKSLMVRSRYSTIRNQCLINLTKQIYKDLEIGTEKDIKSTRRYIEDYIRILNMDSNLPQIDVNTEDEIPLPCFNPDTDTITARDYDINLKKIFTKTIVLTYPEKLQSQRELFLRRKQRQTEEEETLISSEEMSIDSHDEFPEKTTNNDDLFQALSRVEECLKQQSRINPQSSRKIIQGLKEITAELEKIPSNILTDDDLFFPI